MQRRDLTKKFKAQSKLSSHSSKQLKNTLSIKVFKALEDIQDDVSKNTLLWEPRKRNETTKLTRLKQSGRGHLVGREEGGPLYSPRECTSNHYRLEVGRRYSISPKHLKWALTHRT